MEEDRHLPMNLRFFGTPAGSGDEAGAEGEDSANEEAEGAEGEEGADAEGKGAEKQEKAPTLRELLKDKRIRSDLDKHVGKAIETAVKNERAKWEKEQKLTADELEKKRQQEQSDQLSEREAKLLARELKADMVVEIGKRKLPAALIAAIPLTDEDAALDALDSIEEAFRKAVAEGVDEKIKGDTPKDGKKPKGDGKSARDEVASQLFGAK